MSITILAIAGTAAAEAIIACADALRDQTTSPAILAGLAQIERIAREHAGTCHMITAMEEAP